MTSRYGDSNRSQSGPSGSGRPAAGTPGAAARSRRPWGRRKVCIFCAEKIEPEYKSVNRLRRFLSDHAQIESGKKTGTCARHQRLVRREIKRARLLGLLPFTQDHVRITGPAPLAGARPAAESEDSEAVAGTQEGSPAGATDDAADESESASANVEAEEAR